jgi:hypothetical protein
VRASWIRVSALLPRNKKIVALPSDGARFAWIAALCAGKFCEQPGVWESEAQWQESLGRRSRWLEAFITSGLMSRTDAGRVQVKNWEEWQSDPGVTDRVRKHRQQKQDGNGDETD